MIKEDCCGFREADGAVYQEVAWGANKPDDLGAGTKTVNTASSRMIDAEVTTEILHDCRTHKPAFKGIA